MPPSPLEPWPTDPRWVAIARHPSRFAPTLAQLQQAQAQSPVIPRTVHEWITQYTARDLILDSGQLIGCSLTARAYLTATAHEVPGIRLIRVRLIAVGPWLRELSRHPALSQLEELDLTACRLGDEALQILFRSPYLTELRRLKIARNNLQNWATLTHLCQWSDLLELDVTGNGLSLDQLPNLPAGLRSLHLSRHGDDWSSCHELFLRPDIHRLRHFTLSDRAAGPTAEKTVDLRFNGFEQLPPEEFLRDVEVLRLRGNRYQVADLAELRRWSLPRLRWCDLLQES